MDNRLKEARTFRWKLANDKKFAKKTTIKQLKQFCKKLHINIVGVKLKKYIIEIIMAENYLL